MRPRFRRRRSGGSRLRDLGLALVLIFGLGFVAARFEAGPSRVIAGPARVVDGDTIAISGERIRLAGIDAPETGQTCRRDGTVYDCGQRAGEALNWMLSARRVECAISGRDRFGRWLGACRTGKTDLNREMVASGQAVAFGAYWIEEIQARLSGKGLWAGSFERPAAWRRAHEGADETSHRGASGPRSFLRAAFGI